MHARIYQPAKPATQSGRFKTRFWVVEPEPRSRIEADRLIGWMHIFMFILFIGWGGFFLYALVRFRKSRHPTASYAGADSFTARITMWDWLSRKFPGSELVIGRVGMMNCLEDRLPIRPKSFRSE